MFDADEARKSLQDILNKKEYTIYYDDTKNLIESWWERAKEWIAERLDTLFPSSETASSAAGPILIIIIALVVIVLGIITFFIVRNMKGTRKFRDQSPLQSKEGLNWTPDMHLSEAFRQEKRAEYSHAARHLFLALLLYFHQKNWLDARMWKTNWEYYDELRKVNQSWANQFYHLARVFDEVTYGERRMNKEEFRGFHEEVMQWLDGQGESVGRESKGCAETDIK